MSAAPVRARRSTRSTRSSEWQSWLVLLVLIAALAAYFPIRHHLRAASVLLRISDPNARGFLADYATNAVKTEDFQLKFDGGTAKARVYVPVEVDRPPALVILHGVHHLGIEEPRLKNFARAMASHGYMILTPELPGIDNYHVSAASLPVIGEAARELTRWSGAQKVGVLGLSFSGGLALLAASDPKYADNIAFVTAVGAHDDVARVLKFFATNEIPLPTGGTEKLKAHEYGPFVVVYSHPQEFFKGRDVPIAEQAMQSLLWEDVDKAHATAATMSPEGRRKMQLLFDHHTEALAPLLLTSIEKYKSEYQTASPRGHIAGLHVPVFLLHGAADDVIPPAETLWLEQDVPAGLVQARLISPVVSHVELGGDPSARDEFELVHWMSTMLDEADSHRR
jgi:pimeloyl-ACP methyl ester carboxylesterase